MWDAATHDEPYDIAVERDQSIAELREALAQAGPAFLTQVRTIIEDGRLDETFVDAICDPPEVFTYGGMIAHVLTFAAHRRTLVCGALADAGVTDLGSGDPMRWVASAGVLDARLQLELDPRPGPVVRDRRAIHRRLHDQRPAAAGRVGLRRRARPPRPRS